MRINLFSNTISENLKVKFLIIFPMQHFEKINLAIFKNKLQILFKLLILKDFCNTSSGLLFICEDF